MNVRPVTAADESAWLEMRRELWPGSNDHAQDIKRFFAGQSREPLAVFVAEDSKPRILGFVELSIRAYAEGCRTDRVAFLEGWFVVPEARGRGIGRVLLAASEDWAQSQGCSEFASSAELDDDASAAAHRAMRFVDAGSVRCFRKDLSPGPKPKARSQNSVNELRLYGELSSWWPLMSPPIEYVEEAAFYRNTLHNASRKAIQTVLELGSGGGNNAAHLKAHYKEMVLVDVSPGMLAVSRALNPELEHHEDDMRTVRLGRQFDAVFVHDAICYMTTEYDLRKVIETAFVHCTPGGVGLFAPDYVRENFQPGTDHGGTDDGGRGMRWLEWSWDPDPNDDSYVVDYAYLMRHSDGSIRVERDRHVEGLFSRDTWLRLLSDAGFQPRVVPFDHSEFGDQTHEVFVCVRPE
jgi:SAM-dependent methyltransferase/ribosomal protein S18 acetylase RimI-like enzyme